MIYVRNIDGVDLNSAPLSINESNGVSLNIYLSKMEVYLNQKRLESNDCNLLVYTKRTFLDSFYSITFANVLYPTKMCPYIFLNSKVVQLFFRDISNSLINKNRLRFDEVLEENGENLSLKYLENLQLVVQYETLDQFILNPYLFRNVIEINIFGVLNSIETFLFKDFSNLKSLDLSMLNLNEFLQRNLSWITYLNNHIKGKLFFM